MPEEKPERRPRWEAAALWVLVAAAGLDGVTFDVTGLTVYPEYVALAAVLPPVAFAALRRRGWWRWPLAMAPLAVWLAATVAASALNAPRPAHSLLLSAKLVMMVATFAVVANLARSRPAAAAVALAACGAGVAASALLAAAAHRWAGTTIGLQNAPGGSFVPRGTMLEANLLGSYVAAALVLGAAVLVQRHAPPPRPGSLPGESRVLRRAAWVAVALGVPGLLASVTRAAWIAVAAAAATAAAALAWRRGGRAVRTLLLGGAAALAGGGLALLPEVARWRFDWQPHTAEAATLSYRLHSLLRPTREGNLWVRVEICRNAIVHWRQHPVIGWGAGAYGDMFRYPLEDRPGWIPNLFVHHLFDAGTAGLAALLAGIAIPVLQALRAVARAAPERRVILIGALYAVLALLVAFQTTEGTWLAFFWVYLGVLEACAHPQLTGVAETARNPESPPSR